MARGCYKIVARLLYWHRGGKLCVRSVVEPVSARFSRIIGTFGPASGHHNVAFVATDRSFPCEYVHDLSHSLSLSLFPFHLPLRLLRRFDEVQSKKLSWTERFPTRPGTRS